MRIRKKKKRGWLLSHLKERTKKVNEY